MVDRAQNTNQRVPLIGSLGEREGRFSRDSLPDFSAGGPCEQFWHGKGCPLFFFDHPAFPLPITASPILKGTLKDGFGEAVVACDNPEPCKFLSLASCQKRFLRTHMGINLVPHPVVGLVLQEGDAEKVPQALGFDGGGGGE